ncbi:hypothetical protein C8054_14380 [Micromonospora sp. RP3T]|nr:hypothetical protein C8054_14380 [Micromonospora sp. RP3T]
MLREQLDHLVELSRLSSVSIQVLRFEAGAHLADSSGFALLTFEQDDRGRFLPRSPDVSDGGS